MKHLSVGEGTGCAFDLAHARLRAEDERVNEWLNRHAYSSEPEPRLEPAMCAECQAPLPENCADPRCRRCRNREAMREARKRRASGLGHPIGYVACAGCGKSIRKWTDKRYRRTCCDDCLPLARGRHLNRGEAA